MYSRTRRSTHECRALTAVAVSLGLAGGVMAELPPGFVQGDVVSYSYVPNKQWTVTEAQGVLPYLCEYGLMQWEGDDYPLETFHAVNVSRINLVSQWSTAIMFYARESEWRDELINLMIRAFSRRQLIVLRCYWQPGQPNPFQNGVAILERLWANRDAVLTDPEGDQATGRQIINNILAMKAGDENECSLRTSGLQTIYSTFGSTIRDRVMSGEQPFRHIRCWYNMMHYQASCYAASQYDVSQYGRFLLPANTEYVGVDVYHFWNGSDPLAMSTGTRRSISDSWQNVITRYYSGGLSVSPCGSWAPQCRSDTHALLNGLSAAEAEEAMMFYIANSCTPSGYHTTPIETMDAFYDSLKAGPWVGLFWYIYEDHGGDWEGTKRYVERTLQHFTGEPYTSQQLDDFRNRFIASRLNMFNDVIYNQFGYLQLPPAITEVTPDPDSARKGIEYRRQLALDNPLVRPTWSVVQGPAGLTVDSNGLVRNWTPTTAEFGQLATISIRAQNPIGTDEETWQVQVTVAPDLDLDLDVDQFDFGCFQACLTGPNQPYTPDCADRDFDRDGDVDYQDFNSFQHCLSGTGHSPGC